METMRFRLVWVYCGKLTIFQLDSISDSNIYSNKFLELIWKLKQQHDYEIDSA